MLLPKLVEEINAEWLDHALNSRYPGTAVSDVEHLKIIHGSATKVRLGISYSKNDAGLPKSMWVKIGLEPHSDIIRELNFYDVEAACYDHLLSVIDIGAPSSYGTFQQSSPPQVAILMEDLSNRPATFGLATKPMPVAQVIEGVRALARIHSVGWNKTDSLAIKLQPALTWGELTPLQQFVDGADALFNSVRGFSIPVSLHRPDQLKRAWHAYLEAVLQGPQCLVHGDAHLGNTFTTADGKVGFLDWQCASSGHWSHDVGYFMISALDVPDRRKREFDILHVYLAELKSYGVEAPTFADALAAYRRSMIFSFVVWLGNGDDFQPPEINNACFARSGAAIIDHGGFDAII